MEQIYIIYIPGSKDKEPEIDSWRSFRKEFRNRYLNISGRDLLTWMKDELLPWVKEATASKNESFLHSALEQYIDHLEGEHMYGSHQRFDQMDIELNKFTRRMLQLGEDPCSQTTPEQFILLEKLLKKMNEIGNEERIKHSKVFIADKFGEKKVNLQMRNFHNYGPRLHLDVCLSVNGTEQPFHLSMVSLEKVYYGITLRDSEHLDASKRILENLDLKPLKRNPNPKEQLYYINSKDPEWKEQEQCYGEFIELIANVERQLRRKRTG